ncbi:MAG: type II toxin-antitoxin system mRNA interferase toxin, RelE/StbE family [Bacteroidota bacterium]
MILHWSSGFKRALKKLLSDSPEAKEKLHTVLQSLQSDPHSLHLRTHKLKGELRNCWACYVEYDMRIVFQFVVNNKTKEREILLLDIGSHDEVY